MRKTVAAAAMAGALTIGAGSGAALFAPDLVSAQSDDSTDEPADRERPERGQWLEDALAPLVEDGTITQTQADAVIDAIQEAKPDRLRGPGHRLPILEDLTDVLGLSVEEIRTALQDGQTLVDIAEANGVSTEELVDAVVSTMEQRLDGEVENGRLTEEEAAEKLERAEEHANDIVNGELEPRHQHRRGPRGPFGPDENGATDNGAGAEEDDETAGS